MQLGLGQINIFWEDKQKNQFLCEKLIQESKSKQLDLIIFPEMTLTGFSMNTSKISEDEHNSQTISFFKNQAIKNNIGIGFGVVIKKGDKALNKFIILDKEGTVISNYTKIHPFSFGCETKYYSGGDTLSFCTIDNVNISPLICYDLRFPEVFQLLSNTSQLIIVIANWPKPRTDHWLTLLKSRAIENQCFIAGINRIGEGNGQLYSGYSVVFDPYGNQITENLETEGLITAKVDISLVEKYRKEFTLKNDRKNTLYKSLY